jgi:alkyldihydroxyacetonephosphate synthase
MLDDLKKHLWGFRDTFFELKKTVFNNITNSYIIIAGLKYDICNKKIPEFLNFICKIVGKLTLFDNKITTNVEKLNVYYKQLKLTTDEKLNDFDIKVLLEKNNIRYSTDGYELLSHSHGQLSVDEIYQIMYGDFKQIDVVDLVVYPTDVSEIELLYNESKNKNYKIIPYGGGTNVTGCLLIHKKKHPEKQLYISVDMRNYNKILHVNTQSNYAIIQSGACGKEIEDGLNKLGYTMGHEPDSYEFSTLGGWISTYASGMRRNKYGNIEEIVIDFDYVNEHSKNQFQLDRCEYNAVRHSHGSKSSNLFFGHEGNFGIITDVLVNIKKIPETKLYESILFHKMSDGISFLKKVNENGIYPSSIRLVDNEQFKFGQCLKPEKSWLNKIIDNLKKIYLFSFLGFELNKMVACTIMVEGTTPYCDFTINEIKKIAFLYNGVLGGSENGRAGYNLTHAIAYIRDFLQEYGVIGETFETSIEWDKIEDMAESVKTVLHNESKNYINTTPFLSYRISQTYNTGVCVYFTFGFYKDEDKTPNNGIDIYHILKKKMRKVMKEKGGSISHHHGIGQIKSSELNPKYTELNKKIKHLFDKKNVFCNNNYNFLK